jgi:hypothetical protein
LPVGTNGATKDGQLDLGSSGNRFKDLYLSGGVVFGPASASNVSSQTLSSYEQGSWTPDFTTTGTDFSNASVSTGTYTKVGRQVTIQYNCVMSGATSGGTGDVNITGLPFTVNADAIGTCLTGRITFTQTSQVQMATLLDSTTMAPYFSTTEANGTKMTAAQVNGNGTPYFSGTLTYFTNS